MQEQNMAGQTMAEPESVDQATVRMIIERRDMELGHKAQQRKSLQVQIDEDQRRFEQLVQDRDRVTDAFTVALNACELRLEALHRALSRHQEDDPDVCEPEASPKRLADFSAEKVNSVYGGGATDAASD